MNAKEFANPNGGASRLFSNRAPSKMKKKKPYDLKKRLKLIFIIYVIPVIVLAYLINNSENP